MRQPSPTLPAGLAACFISSARDLEGEEVDVEQLGNRLTSAIAAAEECWPSLSVDAELFASHLGARVPFDEVASRSITDLYLCFACAQSNNDKAIEAFSQAHHAGILATLRRLDIHAVQADEIAQEMYIKLFFPSGEGAVPKVATYVGKNALHHWLRAVALRLGFDHFRSSKAQNRQVEVVNSIGVEQVFDAEDPDILHQQRLYGAELKQAISKTISALSVQDRLLLQYHYTDRLNIEKIGKILGIHKTTAFRRLESIRAHLVDETRATMCEGLGVDSDELLSLMRIIPSHIHLSMNRLLRQGES